MTAYDPYIVIWIITFPDSHFNYYFDIICLVISDCGAELSFSFLLISYL